jgi:Short C-terminal domain
MPYRVPREPTQQEAYNRALQDSYVATRRVPARPAGKAMAVGSGRDPVADLKELAELHASGVLSDAEFSAAKNKVLGTTSS